MPDSLSDSQFTVIIRPSQGWIPINLRALGEYRELLYFLVWRDIKVRYKQTILGVAWAIIQPFFTMVMFSLVFGRFFAGVISRSSISLGWRDNLSPRKQGESWTGEHLPCLPTGRLNGAIPSTMLGAGLGMKKAEIDRKFDKTCAEPAEALWPLPRRRPEPVEGSRSAWTHR